MDAPVAMNTSTPSKNGCDAFMTLMKCLGNVFLLLNAVCFAEKDYVQILFSLI
jgi:hypothetical protein